MIRLELTDDQAKQLEDLLVEIDGDVSVVFEDEVLEGGKAEFESIDEHARAAILQKVRSGRHQHAIEERSRRIPSMGPRPAWSLP